MSDNSKFLDKVQETINEVASNKRAMQSEEVIPCPSSQAPKPPFAAYNCHICGFTCPRIFHFNSHMNTHGYHQCRMCDFTSRTQKRTKDHMKECHTEQEQLDAGLSDPATLTVKDVLDLFVTTAYVSDSAENMTEVKPLTPLAPRSIRKRRPYQCRQCDHQSSSKEDHWDHIRAHIPAKKLLSCSICNFVTSYHHHLEYHHFNHVGKKPFQCDKCSYTSINKSMMSSHMKSHSGGYQFKCGDCPYESRYRQGMKSHLKKYNHRAAPGTMNQSRGGSAPPTIGAAPIKEEDYQSDSIVEQDSMSSWILEQELVEPPISSSQTPEPHDLQDDLLQLLLSRAKIALDAGTQEQLAWCSHCGTPFSSFQLYFAHMALHTTEDPFKCRKCSCDTGSSLNFALHLYQADHN